MGWPYQFVDLSDSEKILRRQALDRYAFFAQISALLPVLIVLAFKVNSLAARWAGDRSKGSYGAVPNSPALKSQRRTGLGALSAHVRQLRWWLGDDIILFGQVWGQRDEWIVGSLWAIWLSLLCVLGTGSGTLILYIQTLLSYLSLVHNAHMRTQTIFILPRGWAAWLCLSFPSSTSWPSSP